MQWVQGATNTNPLCSSNKQHANKATSHPPEQWPPTCSCCMACCICNIACKFWGSNMVLSISGFDMVSLYMDNTRSSKCRNVTIHVQKQRVPECRQCGLTYRPSTGSVALQNVSMNDILHPILNEPLLPCQNHHQQQGQKK